MESPYVGSRHGFYNAGGDVNELQLIQSAPSVPGGEPDTDDLIYFLQLWGRVLL